MESECAGQAKAAMEYLVRTHALRHGPDNITVNAVIPGIVESEAWDKCGSDVRPPLVKDTAKVSTQCKIKSFLKSRR